MICIFRKKCVNILGLKTESEVPVYQKDSDLSHNIKIFLLFAICNGDKQYTLKRRR